MLKFLLNLIVGILVVLIIAAFIWFVGELWKYFDITAIQLAYFTAAICIILLSIPVGRVLHDIGAGTIRILKDISKHNNTDCD